MKTIIKLFLPVLCLLLTACRTSRQVVKNSESSDIKTTELKVTYRDTVFYTSPVETSLKLPVSVLNNCPDPVFKNNMPQVWTQKNGNAKATVKLLRDTITLTAECDSIALAAKIKSEYSGTYQERTKVNEEQIKETSKLNWWLMISLVAIAFIAGFITKMLIKISI